MKAGIVDDMDVCVTDDDSVTEAADESSSLEGSDSAEEKKRKLENEKLVNENSLDFDELDLFSLYFPLFPPILTMPKSCFNKIWLKQNLATTKILLILEGQCILHSEE